MNSNAMLMTRGEAEQRGGPALELLDTPGSVWTGGFIGLSIFIIVSYWVIAFWVPALTPLRPSLAAAAIAFVLMAARRLKRGERMIFVSPQSWLLLALFYLMLLSSLFAGDFIVKSLDFTLTFMIKLLALYLLAMNCLESIRSVRVMMWVLAFAAIVPAVGGLYLYFHQDIFFELHPEKITFEEGVARAVYIGHYADPNRLAGCLALLVPALFYLFWTSSSIIGKAFALGVSPLLIATVVLTGSRGGALALAAGLVVAVWFSRHRVIGLLLLAGCAAVAIVMTPPETVSRLAELREGTHAGTAIARLKIWGLSLAMARDHPMLGVGTDCYEEAAGIKYMDPLITSGGERYKSAHSSFVKVLGENGIPAFLIFAWLHVVTFRDLYRLRRAAVSRWGRASPMAQTTAATIAVLASVTVASLTIDYTDNWFPYLFMAATAALKNIGWRLGLVTRR